MSADKKAHYERYIFRAFVDDASLYRRHFEKGEKSSNT
jgi:hypothetical protein